LQDLGVQNMSEKRTSEAILRRHSDFEGGIDDLASVAEKALVAIGIGDGDVSLNARLIRDYTQRGILSRPERQGKEAVYGYQHLVELVAARILLSDGWPLAKVSEYITSAKLGELEALAVPRDLAKAAMRAISDIRARSKPPSQRSLFSAPGSSQGSAKITDRQARLAELRAELPLHLSRIAGAVTTPASRDYSVISLANDVHLVIGADRLNSLSLEEAEAIGKSVTAILVQTRSKGSK
jgi:DNA-binding transcriptional MerR regulator